MLFKALVALSTLAGVARAVPAAVPADRRPGKGACPSPGKGVYDWPLDWDPLGFVSKARVGSPGFEYKLFVDWTWISHIVGSPKCFGQWDPKLCLHPDQVYWDPRNSSTFKNLSSVYQDRTWKPNHIFFENPLHVEYGSDLVQIGPVSSRAVLQLTDFTFNVSQAMGAAYPFTGIFGMSPVYKGDGPDYQSAFYQQWKGGSWKSGLAGFVYCYEEARKKTVCNGHDGIQTMGGIRKDLIKGEKIWWYDVKLYPDVNDLAFVYKPAMYNYWGIELDGLKIGSESQRVEPTSNKSGKAAIFDHASYGRGTPLTPNAYARLVKLTDGKPVKPKSPPNNGPQSSYSVDCSRISSFPTLKYKFAGHSREWEVTPKMYVEKMKDGSCLLNVRALASGDRFIGNFGETFAKEKYIVLDFERNRVGVADMQW
ncbi:eukaryotic aspartyl protease [Hirsutella rhossiliensis]|uniref:Eukaryotic aspartyl protease domain-containing protein n=1 Tax=Hirsutella rhossiliensis TaxID=111463 RepID=A0A9P8N6Q4_9HYPO|nr:eukaryotic aspartyl protease domain-containing protein [Hirsutella rhossiliensis]KAH0967537.1 eukaryotic aspartyl protease domain-containing protein [Hirsutella rhossiliensis]